MQTYLVGGAVRDALMGRPAIAGDRDWVVVGANPAELLALGFNPVGKDFPVFLHPETHEEYALARTERKIAPGYTGFVFHADSKVTLVEDLSRRDLTINAMALPEEFVSQLSNLDLPTLRQVVIDPYGGIQDLEHKVFRHVSPAFAEDPLRILRLARFAARLNDFVLASETLALARGMVHIGEVDALVAERIWQEFSRGLMEKQPSRMFQVLRDVDALERIFPELDRLWGVVQPVEHHPEVDTGIHTMMVLDMAAKLKVDLQVRVACLMHDLGKGTTAQDVLPKHHGHEGRSAVLIERVAQRWRMPADCKELALVVAKEHGNIHRSQELGAPALLRLLERCDALRRPARFGQVLLACECDARGRLGYENKPYPVAQRLQMALGAALQVKADAAMKLMPENLPENQRGLWIGKTLRHLREVAIANMLSSSIRSC